jgi:hypothetical protein
MSGITDEAAVAGHDIIDNAEAEERQVCYSATIPYYLVVVSVCR